MRVQTGVACLVMALVVPSSYACGAALQAKKSTARVKPIASFESGNPFSGGEVVAMHASEGRKSLRIDKNFASMEQAQDWSGTTSSRPTFSPKRGSPSTFMWRYGTKRQMATGPGSTTPRWCRLGKAP